MEYQELKECAKYSNLRTSTFTKDTYISTENMLPNKGGVTSIDSIPTCKTTAKYESSDILISNIRPYFCKIWFATREGGCSNDVLVIKAKKTIEPKFLYYVLSDKNFFNYDTITSKGTKMPRGNKNAIMKYLVPKFSPLTQQKISSILSAYDRLIENNTRRIRLLEQMAENLYKEWFVRFRFPEHENVEMVNGLPKGWKTIHIKELAQLKSGYAFKSEWFVEEGEAVAKIKDIGNILMDTSNFSYVDKENCIKAKKFLLTTGDLTIALTGATIGKISIVPKHKGNIYTNQRLGKFFLGDNPMEKLPFLYCLFKQESMVSNIVNLSNSSSAQPNISPEQIEKIKILGNHDIISMYNKTCNPLFSNILALYSQNQLLTRQRDLLLPRLMSGKLEVKS